jgi:anti-anti-sigma regulatory factor
MHQHATEGAIAGARRSNGNATATAPSRQGPHLTLAPERPWSHTLVLKGDLDHHSAAELEDELVCLLEEGVTALTLDLRDLNELDPRGAHVIALQSALFKGRGRRFDVLVGSPAVQCALAATGGPGLVGSGPAEEAPRRFSRIASQRADSDLSTTVTRELGLV